MSYDIEQADTKSIATILSRQIAAQARPLSAQIHLIQAGSATKLFVVNGSRLYDISQELEQRLRAYLLAGDETGITQELNTLGITAPEYVTDVPLQAPALYALSLAVAQKCNMGCSYCYANQGDFGGAVKNMSLETALQSIDLLLADCPVGGKAQLTFLGGEPLINRPVLRAATLYAATKAREKQIRLGFSITTNGTLLTEADAVFFEEYGFSVTISLDGKQEQHDQLRPMKGGRGSYAVIMEKIKPLLARQRQMQVAARVTVTPTNVDLAETLDEFIGLGFHSVGFSPLLNSSSGTGEMSAEDLESMLQAMIECGLNFEQKSLAGVRYPFLNMVNALKEVAKGTHRPYPCGAGAGYMGVSADGELAACHRFVNEPAGAMGNLNTGVDHERQNSWLAARHVHTQEPCNQCWARYLCGGGCHHEVLSKGRNACEYIRSWLYYTIQAQTRIDRLVPGQFE
ncbi:radical SAM/SPASM domain-containing protein [Hymenobacter lucidus]|uniref:SPASM domain-containing protein n=1 Tax=Hymenobacter lucidus TaxID=2880930 RepID=A0ABS8AM43_9BACT|nr:radical SAM protein [Hymenobacter lucidus]MCB2406351.1 SPASM domain-containing protein [Hymenobacter lucidus]